MRDADVGWLKAGEDDGFGDFGWLHHAGVADPLFGASVADGELGFGASGADGSYFDVVLAELCVEGLCEAYLRELGCAVDGFTGGALQARDGGDEEDGAAVLLDHDGCGVA